MDRSRPIRMCQELPRPEDRRTPRQPGGPGVWPRPPSLEIRGNCRLSRVAPEAIPRPGAAPHPRRRLAPEKHPSRSFPRPERNNTSARFSSNAQAPSKLSPLSSQRSQFLAIFQSHSTVSLDSFRTASRFLQVEGASARGAIKLEAQVSTNERNSFRDCIWILFSRVPRMLAQERLRRNFILSDKSP